MNYLEKNIPGKLGEIISYKIQEVKAREKKVSLEKLQAKLKAQKIKPRDFLAALKTKNKISLISEVKKASPSHGAINLKINPIQQAKNYEKFGANAISVLTDEKFFKGDFKYLSQIKQAVNIPVLQKDFIISPYQIYEAKYYGADAILLITSILTLKGLKELYSLAQKLKLNCLVETHNKADLEKALKIKAKIIGINARDLTSFKININNILRLAPLVPKNKILVAESGIKEKQDVLKLKNAGIQSILVGTTLMRADNLASKIRELKLIKPKIKVCGITDLANAKKLAKLDIDYLGFIIDYPKSPRNALPLQAKNIILNLKKINPKIKFVGVFVDQEINEIKKIIADCKLDIVQLHGEERPNYCKNLKKIVPVWKALVIKEKKDLAKINKYKNTADKILLDSGRGSGKLINLKLLKKLDFNVLAGGIGLDNIDQILEKISPEIIDLNSQVEKKPGIKDINLVQKILKKIN